MSVMESMERRKPRPRRSFTPEFKAEIVELCGRGDRSIGRVARDFDLTETAVREGSAKPSVMLAAAVMVG
jgi:transposase